jgi:hypothetical protein
LGMMRLARSADSRVMVSDRLFISGPLWCDAQYHCCIAQYQEAR